MITVDRLEVWIRHPHRISVAAARAIQVPFLFNPVNALALLFTALIGVMFGYVPARRTALHDPIETLR